MSCCWDEMSRGGGGGRGVDRDVYRLVETGVRSLKPDWLPARNRYDPLDVILTIKKNAIFFASNYEPPSWTDCQWNCVNFDLVLSFFLGSPNQN